MTVEPELICWQETAGGGITKTTVQEWLRNTKVHTQTQTAAGHATCSGQDLWTVWDQRQLEDLTEKHSDCESNICRVPNHEQKEENKSIERGVNELQDKDEKSCVTGGTPSQGKYTEILNCILCWYLVEEWSGQY